MCPMTTNAVTAPVALFLWQRKGRFTPGTSASCSNHIQSKTYLKTWLKLSTSGYLHALRDECTAPIENQTTSAY